MSSSQNPPLAISDAAGCLTFACGCSESGIRTGYQPEAIPLIVAAELRRFADQIGGRADNSPTFMHGEGFERIGTLRQVSADLHRRAHELDGGVQS